MDQLFTDTNEPEVNVSKDGVVTVTFKLPPKGTKLRPSSTGKMLLIASTGGFKSHNGIKLNLTAGITNPAYEAQEAE